MTHDEIIKLAHEAGLSITPPRSGHYDGGRVGCDVVGLRKFAALVAARQAGIEGELYTQVQGLSNEINDFQNTIERQTVEIQKLKGAIA